MLNKGVIGGVIILLIIILGMFVFVRIYSLDTSSVSGDTPTHNTIYDFIEAVDTIRFYQDGTHTLTGEIELPTPCDLLSWDVLVAESYPEQVTIDFNIDNHSDACVQVSSMQKFHITFNASERASIRARIDGRPIDFLISDGLSNNDSLQFEPFLTH